MNDDIQEMYVEMFTTTLRALRSCFGAKVVFLRGADERGAWLLCVAAGPADGEDREAMGMIRYADGAWHPPAPLRSEHAAEVFGVLDAA